MGAAEAQRCIHAQQTLWLGPAAGYLPLHLLDLTENAFCIDQVRLTFGREADAARRSVQQTNAKTLLQLRKPLGYSGGSEVQLTGCRCQAASRHQLAEKSKFRHRIHN
ncbi:hypothetical protein D3C72_1512920 [compost metagenome]